MEQPLTSPLDAEHKNLSFVPEERTLESDNIDQPGVDVSRQREETEVAPWRDLRDQLTLILTEFIRIGPNIGVILMFSASRPTTDGWLQFCIFDDRRLIDLQVHPAPSPAATHALGLDQEDYGGDAGTVAGAIGLSPSVAANTACSILTDLGALYDSVHFDDFDGPQISRVGSGQATPAQLLSDLQVMKAQPPPETPTGTSAKVPRPQLRLVRTARDAEENACVWMQWMGYIDARITPMGADAGVDVDSCDAVAQVKMEGVPTGRPVVQALFGVASAEGKRGLFFSLAGYTPMAVEWANRVGVALFTFDFQGEPVPINPSASQLM